MLQELDRPIIEVMYEPWDRMVKLQVLSASQFVDVMQAVNTAPEEDHAAKIAAMSQVCALGVLDPKATADEWANDVTLATLMDLGNRVLSTTSEQLTDDAKKN